MSLYLVQLVCSNRHCILAAGFEEGHGNVLEAIEHLEEIRVRAQLDKYCRLCHSQDFQYESGKTIFDTLIAATPSLTEIQFARVDGRSIIKGVVTIHPERNP